MREVIMNQKTNLLQLEEHFYQLVDVEEPDVVDDFSVVFSVVSSVSSNPPFRGLMMVAAVSVAVVGLIPFLQLSEYAGAPYPSRCAFAATIGWLLASSSAT